MFDRHGKNVVPTIFGNLVAETARLVVDALDALTRWFHDTSNLEDGELARARGITPPSCG